MPKPQDIQDLLDHSVSTAGVHNITPTPTADGVVQAKDTGKIDSDWLDDSIPRKSDGGTVQIIDLPPEVVLLVNGKIPNGLLPTTINQDIFKSGGNITQTKFQLADGTDLITLINQKVASMSVSVQNIGNPSTTFPYVTDVFLSVPAAGVVALNRTYNCNCDCNCNCCSG